MIAVSLPFQSYNTHMNLVCKSLNVVVHRQILLEVLDSFRILSIGCEHAKWNVNLFGIFRVDHGRMDFADGREGSSGLRAQPNHLRQSVVDFS